MIHFQSYKKEEYALLINTSHVLVKDSSPYYPMLHVTNCYMVLKVTYYMLLFTNWKLLYAKCYYMLQVNKSYMLLNPTCYYMLYVTTGCKSINTPCYCMILNHSYTSTQYKIETLRPFCTSRNFFLKFCKLKYINIIILPSH